MSPSRLIKALSTGCLVLLFLPGYAAETFLEFPVHPAASYKVTAQSDGVVVGLEPVEDPSAQQTYFHTELASKGFVPVFVVIDNNSKTESILLNKALISYDQQEGKTSTPKASTKGAIATESVAVASVPFGGGIMWPVIGQMFAHASQIQQNLMLREMQSRTLSPGASMHGFIYVAIPKKEARKKSYLHIPVTAADSGKESIINLSF